MATIEVDASGLDTIGRPLPHKTSVKSHCRARLVEAQRPISESSLEAADVKAEVDECYPYWTGYPDRTVKRIKTFTFFLGGVDSSLPDWRLTEGHVVADPCALPQGELPFAAEPQQKLSRAPHTCFYPVHTLENAHRLRLRFRVSGCWWQGGDDRDDHVG